MFIYAAPFIWYTMNYINAANSKICKQPFRLSRLVFDRWIEIVLVDPEAAQRSLAATIWLRTSLERLLEIKLEGNCKQYLLVACAVVLFSVLRC